MRRPIPTTAIAALLLPLALATSAAGQCPGGVCPPRAATAPTYYHPTHRVAQAPTGGYLPAPAAYAAPRAEPGLTGYGDPLAAVNQARAARGLRPLAYDPTLASYAAANNAAQSRAGLGHHVRCGALQCAAVGTPTAESAVAMWSRSAPHAAILYSPGATSAGLAVGWNSATLNVR